jgi:hypothetical protein
MSRRVVVQALLLVIAVTAMSPAGPLHAQALTSVRANPLAHPVLERSVTLDVRAALLTDALSAFSSASGLSLTYSRDIIPQNLRVTVQATSAPAGEVLNRLLNGTGLEALVSDAGNLAIAAIAAVRQGSPAAARAVPMTVRGRIVDAATGSPLNGVFVSISDADGVRRAGVLTNADGWYIARVPSQAAYVVRAEIIGYGSAERNAFVDESGVVLDDIRLQQTAIALASIEVEASDGVCRMPREIGAATHQLWEEVRKALTVAAWGERDAGVAFQVVQYEHTKDLISGEVMRGLPHDRRVLSGVGRTPFVTAAADELATLGYVRRMPTGYTYYGLDAAILLSQSFAETHCFRLRLGPRNSELVGLAFEPVPGRTAPDVAGVLWLDRRSMELQHLEYEYTRHLSVGEAPPDLFGGRTEFQRLPNGAWIVSDWWIRMPQGGPPARMAGLSVLGRAPRLQRLRAAGLSIREEGGAVRYLAIGSAPEAEIAVGVISGIVYDSTRMRPLRGATVFIEGVPQPARADASGRFRFGGLPPGEYRIGFFHAYTDSIAIALTTRHVQTVPGSTSQVMLAVPADAACPLQPPPLPGDAAGAATVALVGFVLDRRGTPAPGASVNATWGAANTAIVSDHNARYIICGIPAGSTVRINSGRTRIATLSMPMTGVFRQNLVLR